MTITLFLDIDGVLNSPRNFGKKIENDKYIKLLNLCNKYRPEIIITSEWRKDMRFVKKELRELSNYIKGRTRFTGDRVYQIKKYIEDHDIKKYIIIDDDKRLVEGLNNVIIVNGLNDKNINKIEKLIINIIKRGD